MTLTETDHPSKADGGREALPKKIVVGVWKDRLFLQESASMANKLHDLCRDLQTSGVLAAVAPPPYAAHVVCEALRDSPVRVVYQDVHWPAQSGSYIGSTPISVLQELDVQATLVGHSERRRFFGETDIDINRKLAGLLDNRIHPILCVGDNVEDWAQRRSILAEQIEGALRPKEGIEIDVERITIAYEPVWAISTWRSESPLPTGREVARMLELVREVPEEIMAAPIWRTAFLFGGSVGPSNADEYFSTRGVDGALVGGASLDAASMTIVFQAAADAWSTCT